MEGHWKFLGGGRSQKSKTLQAKYEAKLEFLGGRGCKTKEIFTGGCTWIFSGTAHCSKPSINFILIYNVFRRH